MRGKIMMLAGLVCICTGISAQEQTVETAAASRRFFFGAGFSNLQRTGDFGSTLDFSFLLYSNPSPNNPAYRFNIRNSFLLDGSSFLDEGALLSLSEKLNFEAFSLNELFRYYSFLQGGIGVSSDGTDAPSLIYNFGWGFGLDVFIERTVSIFFDYTLLYNILDYHFSIEDINPKFQMGMRIWF